MLTALAIRDVVLIEALDLEFGSGLAVLTGETGAGKSILLDALGLALGGRGDSGLVRKDAAQAIVTASFDLDAAHPALSFLADNGLAAEQGDALIIRRQLKADGGSRAFINDQPVSAGLLRELGAQLVEIHGQHDERGLINPRGHRALLDSFGRLDTGTVALAWQGWQAAQQALELARQDLENAARDREWLDHAVQQLTAVDAQPGEDQLLSEERSAMQKGARLAEDLETVTAHLSGSEGALAALRQAARRLDRIAHEHPQLGETLAALDRAVIEASEGEEKLEAALRAMSFDPDRLETVETRLFDIRALARKHRVDPDQLPGLTIELREKLSRIEAGDAGLAALEAQAAQARKAYEHAAAKLSDDRHAAAERLDRAVAAELAPLKLDAARVRTALVRLPDTQWGAAGRDRVEFEIATNPGAPFAPLAKIASGGELSRFILALKVALAEEGAMTTMIFDEIDRGVGGAVASAVGERLARLADGAQLLVVTHSPQVAARADRHWLIAKASDGTVTRTSVHALDESERREEIARMLSGTEITDEARAQASRLLEVA
ncbi:MAG: DNA repair protein RecN [Sphingomonadaceae bacterium]